VLIDGRRTRQNAQKKITKSRKMALSVPRFAFGDAGLGVKNKTRHRTHVSWYKKMAYHRQKQLRTTENPFH